MSAYSKLIFGRVAKNLRLLTFSALVVLLTLPMPASAHRPVWGETLGPTQVDNIVTSYAYYQTLQAAEIDILFFDGLKGQKFHAGIQIPDLAAYQDYTVSMALFGPDLPKVAYDQLPPEHPEGLGALIAPSVIGDDFFEPFTQTNFLGRQSLDTELPADGTYYLLIWNGNGAAGKYVVDIGYEEVFGATDLLVFPIWWLRVHWYFEHYLLIGALASPVVLVIARLRRRALRTSTSASPSA